MSPAVTGRQLPVRLRIITEDSFRCCYRITEDDRAGERLSSGYRITEDD
jgi:hypothetical protein